MARDITEYFQKQGISLSPKYSDTWAQHDPKAVEEHLKAASGCVKASNHKGISCKMLGTCLGSGGTSTQYSSTSREPHGEDKGQRAQVASVPIAGGFPDAIGQGAK